MSSSEITKKYKRMFTLFSVLHFICLFGPLLFYIPYGFSVSSYAGSKLTLSFSLIVCLVLTFISFICETTVRNGLIKTIMWIIVLSITIALNTHDVKTFICIMSIFSIIDELVIVRIKDKAKLKLSINKELDKRGQ